MTVSLITPTHNRPDAFPVLEKWVARWQGFDEWIVVCDGDYDRYSFTMGQKAIHRTEASPLHSICANYIRAVEEASGDVIVCIEDDDFYSASFLAEMVSALERYPLAGFAPGLYWKPGTCLMLPNTNHCSLAATGFRREVVPLFLQMARCSNPYIDQMLWIHWHSTLERPAKLLENRGQQVGIKGLFAGGFGHWHREGTQGRHDSLLEEWIGKEDYEFYLRYYHNRQTADVHTA